jgi:hypothetical protein
MNHTNLREGDTSKRGAGPQPTFPPKDHLNTRRPDTKWSYTAFWFGGA